MLIEFKIGNTGYATTVAAGGASYSFERDRAGRFVAEVNHSAHIAVFLAVEHYREVEPLPHVPEPPVAGPLPTLQPAPNPAPHLVPASLDGETDPNGEVAPPADENAPEQPGLTDPRQAQSFEAPKPFVPGSHLLDQAGTTETITAADVGSIPPGIAGQEAPVAGPAEAPKPHLPQLDHDGDGRPGGSKPKMQRVSRKKK